MGIPESQLETWSHQGSVTQSKNTYATIKKALEKSGTPYAGLAYEVFLQGSYGNDTNIYAESDVDVIIQLNSSFKYDIEKMELRQQQSFKSAFTDSDYTPSKFRTDVLSVLTDAFGSDVKDKEKAIKVLAGSGRRNADVIPALQYRKYQQFADVNHQLYTEGICFTTAKGELIINYPKLHSVNLTKKHQLAGEWFKPAVRIFKNMRGWLVDNKRIDAGTAPSYFVEGLLYNVPTSEFGVNYATTVAKCLNWLNTHTRDQWVCANEQYKLIHPTSPVTWRDEKCTAFLAAAIKMWNDWQ